MGSAPHEGRLVPLTQDVDAAVRLATEAIEQTCRRAAPAQDPGSRVTYATERLRAGTLPGRLYEADGSLVGLVLWEEEDPPAPGLHVHLLHLTGASASEAGYAALLDRVQKDVRPLLFIPADLSGLSPDEERRLASGRGFSRFGRSEMRFPPERPIPPAPIPTGVRIRPLRPGDEPRVAAAHAAAFGTHFDFYLFRRDPDPQQSSAREVHDMMNGRWGELLSSASFLAETDDGRTCGMSLFVRAPYGALLISLGVEPSHQGRGLGRALTAAGVRALREGGERVIALNVTEGNLRAVRMYERFGFVRTIGPEWSWYSTDLVPISPDGTPSRPLPPPDPRRSGSTSDEGPRTPRA